jgi:serine/threonine protein kinase
MNVELKKILRGKKGCSPASHLWSKNGKGTVQIGQGQYGKVFRGCVDEECKKYVVYKEIKTPSLTEKLNNVPLAKVKNIFDEINPKMEFTIARKLEGFGVPKMYLYKSCDGKDILYSEYVRGEEFAKWMLTKPTFESVKSAMVQVIYNLYRIQQKYPKFRHHDLHLGNILIRPVPKKDIQIKLKNETYTISNGGVEAVIIDFGFSLFPRIKNPLINTGNYRNLGISRNSNKLYDLHYFLNSLYAFVVKPQNMTQRRVKNFITSILKNGYMNRTSEFVKNYRLRGNRGQNHTSALPDFETVLSSSFFVGKKPKVLPIPNARPVQKVSIVPPKPKTPVNQKAAMARAIAVLKANKKKPQQRPRIVRRRP